jgi:hypothetical protein
MQFGHALGITFIATNTNSMNVQGVSFSIASCIDVQGGTLSIASCMDVQGISLSNACSMDVPCRV